MFATDEESDDEKHGAYDPAEHGNQENQRDADANNN
jgi:hypothetical protein